MTEPAIEVRRGLKDVYFERSATSLIDGRAGELRYRGYSIHELAAQSTFEETAYLLLKGELPNHAELDAFDAELKQHRTLPATVVEMIHQLGAAHPMEVLRTATWHQNKFGLNSTGLHPSPPRSKICRHDQA